MFQRRHYEFIASAIRDWPLRYPDDELQTANRERDAIATYFANQLALTSANFNRRRFLDACGVNLLDPRGPKPLEQR